MTEFDVSEQSLAYNFTKLFSKVNSINSHYLLLVQAKGIIEIYAVILPGKQQPNFMASPSKPNSGESSLSDVAASASEAQTVKEKSAEKTSVILAGALDVFTTQGYAAASMDRIATAAGVSKPTLYAYFKNKEGLFAALIQQMVQGNRSPMAVLDSAAILQIPPEQVLTQMATMVLKKLSTDQSLLTLMRLMIGESARFPALTQTFVREIEKPLLEKLSAYFAAQTQLTFPDPMVAARIFVGSIVHYNITQYVLHGNELLPMERDRLVRGLVQTLIRAGSTTE